MPSVVDISVAVLFAVVLAGFEHAYLATKFKQQIADAAPNARRNAYRWEAVAQQVTSALVVALWITAGRSWAALGVVPPRGWRLVVGLGIVVVVALFVAKQLSRVRRLSESRRAALRTRLTGVDSFLPRTPDERRWFAILSVTAGVCEELLYRGYFTWLLASYVGLPGAIAVVMIVFGMAHAYQGGRGFLNAAAFSLGMSLMVILTGWLVPAMIVHALFDLNSGEIGFSVLADRGTPPLATAA